MNTKKNSKIDWPAYGKNFVLILLGIFSAAFGLKGMLIPNGFIDGGVTGISLLVSLETNIPVAYLLIIINIPFIIIGYKTISKFFALFTSMAILALAVILLTVNFPDITNDKLLIAVFGGFFLGLGVGLCMRGGCVIDGTEIIAVLMNKRTSFTIGDIILILNVIIFSVAAYYRGIETALYSILTYLAASRTVNYVVTGLEEYTGVTIVSSNPEEIRLAIIEEMGRGVTVLKGKRGFGKRGETREDLEVIFCVITRLEIPKLKIIINRIDENAFVVMHGVNDTTGGMIKKRALH